MLARPQVLDVALIVMSVIIHAYRCGGHGARRPLVSV